MSKNKLFEKIYRHHLNIVRDLNNSHIFIKKAGEYIRNGQESEMYESLKNDLAYKVPDKKNTAKITDAYRTAQEVNDILDSFVNEKLFEKFLVSNISKFESYLFNTLKEVN